MGILYKYKCIKCGYSVDASEDGSISLMSSSGFSYRCAQCYELFARCWKHEDIRQAVSNYSFEKDECLADLFTNAISEEFRESFRRDVLWFQQEVAKGKDSKYYGDVVWSDFVFWHKLFLYLKRRKYSESINIKEIEKKVNMSGLKKGIAYSCIYRSVRCNCCNEIAQMWSPKDGCPKCGATMEASKDECILID